MKLPISHPHTLTPAQRRRVAEIHVQIARLRAEQARLRRAGKDIA